MDALPRLPFRQAAVPRIGMITFDMVGRVYLIGMECCKHDGPA